KVGVQLLPRHMAVFAGGEHREEAAGGNGGGRELPFRRIACVVGQIPSAQIQWRSGGVLDFNPIGMIAVLIENADSIAGEKLADHRGGCQQMPLLERSEAYAPRGVKAATSAARIGI